MIFLKRILFSLVEIDRIQKGEGKREGGDTYLDLFTTKVIKLKERVLIPVKQYPKVSLDPTLFLFLSSPLFFPLSSSSLFNSFCSGVSITQSHGVTWKLSNHSWAVIS